MQMSNRSGMILALAGLAAAVSPLADAIAARSGQAHGLETPKPPSAKQNHDVVRRLAVFVRDYYQDEATARRIHDLLIRNVTSGRYAGVSPEALMRLVNADLQSASKDLHLQIEIDPDAPSTAAPPPPMPVPLSKPGPAPTERDKMWDMPAEQVARDRSKNFGIAKVEILPGNVGLLEITTFPVFTKDVPGRYAAAFELLRDTSSLVIDLTNAEAAMV